MPLKPFIEFYGNWQDKSSSEESLKKKLDESVKSATKAFTVVEHQNATTKYHSNTINNTTTTLIPVTLGKVSHALSDKNESNIDGQKEKDSQSNALTELRKLQIELEGKVFNHDTKFDDLLL